MSDTHTIRMLTRNHDTELGTNGGDMAGQAAAPPSPARSAAGKANRAKRKGLTPAGRERLRQAALRNRPWEHSTGPTTAAGKAQAAANGKRRQVGPVSVRELRAGLAGLTALARDMAEARALVGGGRSG